jgi:hypothetical protein
MGCGIYIVINLHLILIIGVRKVDVIVGEIFRKINRTYNNAIWQSKPATQRFTGTENDY